MINEKNKRGQNVQLWTGHFYQTPSSQELGIIVEGVTEVCIRVRGRDDYKAGVFSGHSRKLPIWTLIGENNHPQDLCRFKWDSTQWRTTVSRDHAFLKCLHVCHKILCTAVTLGCEEETGWTIRHCRVTWSEYETGPYTADLSSYIIILSSIVLRASHTPRKYSTVFMFCACERGTQPCVQTQKLEAILAYLFSLFSTLFMFFFGTASFTDPEITLLARLPSLLGTRICTFLLPLALT